MPQVRRSSPERRRGRKGGKGGRRIDGVGGGAAVGRSKRRGSGVRDLQRGNAIRERCVRAAMRAPVPLDVHSAMAGQEEHLSLLQIPVAVR